MHGRHSSIAGLPQRCNESPNGVRTASPSIVPDMTFSAQVGSRVVRSVVLALLLVAGWRQEAAAQTAGTQVTSTTRLATRVQLNAAATQFDQFAASTAYSERTRARARAEAVAIRRRLADGDFRVGDRITLRVEGQQAAGGIAPVADTVTVLEGRVLTIAGYRQVSVAGVLRAELETKLRTELEDYFRTATVIARPLMRVAVFGSVTRPGYLSVPMETSLDQLLTFAGGPAATADMQKVKLMRADTVLLSPEAVVSAVSEGRTLDAIGVMDGDALVVPLAGPPWDRNATLQIVGLFLTPLLTIFVVQR
jgi:protein involved in polysaccharide export with SLBB domain